MRYCIVTRHVRGQNTPYLENKYTCRGINTTYEKVHYKYKNKSNVVIDHVTKCYHPRVCFFK